jgi:hypothetical protein
LGVLLQLVGYLLRFCWALVLPRAVTAAQLLAIQSQLAVEVNRSSGRRQRHRQFSPAFRILWAVLSKCLNGWEVSPQETSSWRQPSKREGYLKDTGIRTCPLSGSAAGED